MSELPSGYDNWRTMSPWDEGDWYDEDEVDEDPYTREDYEADRADALLSDPDYDPVRREWRS